MNWQAFLIFAVMPAVSVFAIYSVIQDVRLGRSHIYGRPMSSRQDAPLGFTFDIILKLLMAALFAIAPVYAVLEILRA